VEEDYTLALRTLLGNVSTTPNLQGMFLRGAGISPLSTELIVKEGPELRSTQQDSNKEHSHNQGDLVTDTDGEHVHSQGTHPDAVYNRVAATGVGYTVAREPVPQSTRIDIIGSEPMPPAGDHTHTITGNTGDSGGIESRPVNYGVNYIIKL